MTFFELGEKFLQYEKCRVNDQTLENYRYAIMHSICPHIGDLPICEFTSDFLQEYVYEYSKTRRAATVKRRHGLLKQMFTLACRGGYIEKNPMCDVVSCRGTGTAPRRVYTVDEVSRLLAATADDRYLHAAISIAFATGMRRGEIYALSWDCVDFCNSFISVQRSLCYFKRELLIKEPKTRYSLRRIDVDSHTMDVLEGLKNNQKYVFSDAHGRIQYKKDFNFRRICDKAGIVPRRFHDLRHTHATMLLANGVHPKIVQERLGHASIQTTMDTYGHTFPTIQRPAVIFFENLKITTPKLGLTV